MAKVRASHPSIARLNELLTYSGETGEFYWTVKAVRKVRGKRAGSQMPSGYRRIKIDDVEYYEHHLALFIATGLWPSETADHKNRVRWDNRLDNLRDSSFVVNSQNSKVGKPYWDGSKWIAQLTNKGATVYLGRFACFGQALKVRNSKKRELHPEAEAFRK